MEKNYGFLTSRCTVFKKKLLVVLQLTAITFVFSLGEKIDIGQCVEDWSLKTVGIYQAFFLSQVSCSVVRNRCAW